MSEGVFELDILVQGFPGKSVCHGGLGWSTIALLRRADRIVLVDGGTFAMRHPLVAQLAARNLKPTDVTDVILTHAHHDHAVNWIMFDNAAIAIGADELDWAINVPIGDNPVPELYVRELCRSPRVRRLQDGDEVLPGIRAVLAPGHTPGHLMYVASDHERDFIFTGDAAKNRAEMLSMTVDATGDAAASRRSLEKIWSLWRRRPGNMLVPGHDLPMVLDNGKPVYVGERQAAIKAWFGDNLEQMTHISLTSP